MSKQDARQVWWDTWWMGLGGSVFAGILLLIMFRGLFCYYTFQVPSASFITMAFGALSGILASVLKSIEVRFLRPLAYFLMGLLLTLAVSMLVAPFITRMNMNYCVPDLPVLVDLIDREGLAVVNEDMSEIHSLYEANAVVVRADTDEYLPAYTYYSQKFAREEHCNVSHSDHTVQEYSDERVRLTTSNMGIFGIEGQGCTIAYANPPGSDEWTFEKVDGTWKIILFVFNRKTE